MKLWSGRLQESLDSVFSYLNSSLEFDQRLWEVDITGSQAWANALEKAGVIAPEENQLIQGGLADIFHEFQQEKFEFSPLDEDIHTAVERRLTEKIGPVGGKLHTGRSRNDQVATDFRLWMKNAIHQVESNLLSLQKSLTDRAQKDMGVIMPGYTHLQQAQPILLSHWWLSHFWALQRDRQHYKNLYQEVQIMPLGCGALAGTTFPIDRFALAKDLGFNSPAPNSLDAISDRDFAVEFLSNAALVGVHLSRMAETLILFSTQEFGFITLSDKYSTGSSLMPQKKNPDSLELIRSKSGMLAGRLNGLLTTLKGLPSAYDKDLQEDKMAVFDAFDTLSILLQVMQGVIATLTVNDAKMLQAVNPLVLATDMADYLVQKGLPFRTAYSAVGNAVRKSIEMGVDLPQMPLAEWQQVNPAFGSDLFDVFDVTRSIKRRAAWGGTAPDAVKKQLELAISMLEETY